MKKNKTIRPVPYATFLITTLACVVLVFLPENSRGQSEPFQVVETTIEQIHSAYESGTLTASELVQLYIDRIVAYDQQGPNINSIIALNPDALGEAEQLDAMYESSGPVGPLHGIPLFSRIRWMSQEWRPH